MLLAMLGPRVTIVVLWLFTTYLSRAYEIALWPVLGFFFMPYTTLLYAVAQNTPAWKALGTIFIVIGVLCDFGVIGGAAKARQRRPNVIDV